MLSINISLVPSLDYLLKEFWTKQHENCPDKLQIYHLDFEISRAKLNFTHRKSKIECFRYTAGEILQWRKAERTRNRRKGNAATSLKGNEMTVWGEMLWKKSAKLRSTLKMIKILPALATSWRLWVWRSKISQETGQSKTIKLKLIYFKL